MAKESDSRYYQKSHLTSARLMAMLGRLDMPLDTITRVLEPKCADATRALHDKWRGFDNARTDRRKLVAHIDKILKEESMSMCEVHTRRVAEENVSTIEKRIQKDEFRNVIQV